MLHKCSCKDLNGNSRQLYLLNELGDLCFYCRFRITILWETIMESFKKSCQLLFLGNHLNNYLFSFLCSVIAISCYQCKPNPPNTMCTSNVNTVSCDKLSGTPTGASTGMKYDACGITSYQLTKGEENTAINYMGCGVKVSLVQLHSKYVCVIK